MDVGARFGIYFKELCANSGLIMPYVLINDEHLCLRDEPLHFAPERKIYAVIDLFGVTKSVDVLHGRRSGSQRARLCL